MAEALITPVLEQLTSIICQQIRKEVSLVTGVSKEIQNLTRNFETIKAVLDDAEKRQAKDKSVQIWLAELLDVSMDMDDVLDEWCTVTLKDKIQGSENALSPLPVNRKKVCYWFIPSPRFRLNRVVLRRDIALKIKAINRRLDSITSVKDRYNFQLSIAETPEEVGRVKTTSFVDVSEIRGRDQDKETLVSRLLSESRPREGCLPVISIVGMGGIGKTTLAQMAYNEGQVKNHFEKLIWVCVSDPFDETRVASAIIESLEHNAPSVLELESLLRKISTSIKDKKFLLVLDDVWTEDSQKWEPLRNALHEGAQGSRILVTTRSERVAMMLKSVDPIHPNELTREECWSIFSHIAFFGRSREEREDLEEIGMRIVDRCKGLPLAAKVLGGLMHHKKSKQQWQGVLDSDLWDLEEAKKDVISPLWLSYHDLPSALKRCFSYCAMFPKDYVIQADHLIKFWMANGLLNSKSSVEMEITGQEYFDNLAMRSLFQDFVQDDSGRIESCKMHDIVHDFAQLLNRNECRAIELCRGGEVRVESSYAKLRHSTFICNWGDPSLSTTKINLDGLHTLVVEQPNQNVDKILQGLLRRITCLRVLELGRCGVRKLPEEVGDLIHLRYLSLEENDYLNELPETVCGLCNLQTLKISGCHGLQKLPIGIGKLVDLRHLENVYTFGVVRMPKGIAELGSLRTLREFRVCPKNDGEGCGIGVLGKLNCLQGELTIRGLGQVADASEAETAGLKTKQNVHRLELNYFGSNNVDPEASNSIIEALQPPPGLEHLRLDSYQGSRLPNWIASLNKLKVLELHRCPNLEALPECLKMIPLQTLEMFDCRKLIDRFSVNGSRKWDLRDCLEWPRVSHIPSLSFNGSDMRDMTAFPRRGDLVGV